MGKPHKGKTHIEDLGVCGSVILKYILNKLDGRSGLASSGSEYRKEAGLCKHGNKHSVFINAQNFLTNREY